jgi:hypothetical protein
VHKLIFAALLVSAGAFGNPFLIGDVSDTRADTCIYTRTTAVSSAVVVDAVNGLPANGNRVCKIDLASDPRTGTVTLALKDSILGDTGPAASYTFPVALHAPGNLRLIP